MVLTEFPIHVDQLCVGVYVRLDLEGKRNPFLRSSFKIKNEKQIEKIKRLGLSHVYCDLSKSDQLPIPTEDVRGKAANTPPVPTAQQVPKTPVSAELLGLKQETIERNKERKAAFVRCEKKYEQAVSSVVTILRRASGRAADAAGEASKVVEAMVGTFLSDRDVVVNLMSSKPTEEKKNYHALNTTVLSMMVGKEVNLNAQHMHSLGMGALFHDIGKGRVNIKHMERGKATTVRRAEESQYRGPSAAGREHRGRHARFSQGGAGGCAATPRGRGRQRFSLPAGRGQDFAAGAHRGRGGRLRQSVGRKRRRGAAHPARGAQDHVRHTAGDAGRAHPGFVHPAHGRVPGRQRGAAVQRHDRHGGQHQSASGHPALGHDLPPGHPQERGAHRGPDRGDRA